jgi:hypothetical protein
MTYEQMKNMFGSLPVLGRLVIHGGAFNLGWQTTSHVMTIKLLSLRSLSTSSMVGEDIGRFLRLISAPLLEFLSLDSRGTVEGILHAWNPALHQTQYPSLLSLAVVSGSMSEPTLTKLSRVFPTITHLTISGQKIKPFATFLQERDMTTGLLNWLNLESISLSGNSFFGTSFIWGEPELFSDVLAERMRMGHPVKRLVLSKALWSDARLYSRDSVVRTFLGIKVEQNGPDNLHFALLEDWDDGPY